MPIGAMGGAGGQMTSFAPVGATNNFSNLTPSQGGQGARYVQGPRGGYPGPFGNFNLGFGSGGPGGSTNFNFTGGSGGAGATGPTGYQYSGPGGYQGPGGSGGGGGGGTATGGGGGGGAPSGQSTAPAGGSYAGGPPLTNTATVDPRLQQYLTDVGTQKAALTAGTDVDAQNAMNRQQEGTLGLMKAAGQDVSARGFEGGGGAGLASQSESQIAGAGARSASDLNAQLAAGSRQMQLQALGMQGGAASDISRQLASSNQLGLNQWQAGANEQFRNAQLAAMLQNQGFNQFMGIAGLGMQMSGLGGGGLYSGFGNQPSYG